MRQAVTAKDQARDYCFDLVRQGDKDRFLASLFAPDPVRPHLHALYAFNIELARIRDVVSEPALGEIRLQWWLDAVDSIYSHEVPAHPVAQALARTIDQGNLPKVSLRNMAEARRFDLYDDPMPSLNDLEGYLGETSGALLQMSVLVIDPKRGAEGAEISGLAGVAMGIAGLLRSLPARRARGQCYVPGELLKQNGLTPADLIAGQPEAALSAVLGELRDTARSRLEEARAKQKTIAGDVFPAFLPVALTQLYLDRLDTLGSAGLYQAAELPQLRRQWHLYWCARRKGF